VANLIDRTYLVGEILIPNIISGSGHPAATINQTDVDRLITKYEKKYLKRLLGKDLYKAFIENQLEAWAVALIAELRDTVNKVSPIAYYVWCAWKRDNTTRIGSGGEVQTKNENADTVSPTYRMLTNWNECIDLTCDVLDWMDENAYLFPVAADTDYDTFRPMNEFGI